MASAEIDSGAALAKLSVRVLHCAGSIAGGILMHTVMIIGGGLLLLALFVLVGRQLGSGNTAAAVTAATAALWFIPVWLVAAAISLSIGVRHGYTVAEEVPIGLVVFGMPAAVAAAI